MKIIFQNYKSILWENPELGGKAAQKTPKIVQRTSLNF